MLDDKKDDVFLARWVNNELTSDELADFQSSPDYQHYAKIKAGADALDLSEYNIEKELIAIKSKRKTETAKKQHPTIKLWPYFTVAASILVVLGLFLFNTNENYTTNYGEQLAVTLPDGSEMILNAKSEASFNIKEWKENRTVSLDGEAYFRVKKGSKFTVTTAHGEISVLGTEFNVQSQSSLFEVICYEGKVRVSQNESQEILIAGKGYRNLGNTTPESWTFEASTPTWINNTSSFRNTPVKYVFEELKDQYDISIDTTSIDTSIIYTGTFPNNDIQVALKTVFSTLGIEYTLSKDGKTVVLEK